MKRVRDSNPDYPCVVCRKDVAEDDEAISCDSCDNWTHRICGTAPGGMCSHQLVRYTLIVYNVIFMLGGLGVLSAGVYVNVEKVEYGLLLGSSVIPTASYVMVAAGSTVLLVSLLGCAGAVKEHKRLLTGYFVFLLLIFIMEAAGGILGFIFYDRARPLMDKYVQDAVLEKYGYDEYKAVTQGINFLHQEFDCCGYINYTDWKTSKYFEDADTATVRGSAVVPRSCCKNMLETGCDEPVIQSSKVHMKGCSESFEEWLKNNLMIVGAVGVSVSMVQLIGMILSVCLCKKVAEDETIYV